MKNIIKILFLLLFLNSFENAMEANFSKIETSPHAQAPLQARHPDGYFLGTPQMPYYIYPGTYDPNNLPTHCAIVWRYISPTPAYAPAPAEAYGNVTTTPITSIAPAFLVCTKTTTDIKKPLPLPTSEKTIDTSENEKMWYPCLPRKFIQIGENECKKLLEQKDRQTKAKHKWQEKNQKNKKNKTMPKN